MRHLIIPVISIFLILTGLAFLTDVILVLRGQVIPVSHPEFNMYWNDSPIFHYNVRPASNMAIGLMGLMGLTTGLMIISFTKPFTSK